MKSRQLSRRSAPVVKIVWPESPRSSGHLSKQRQFIYQTEAEMKCERLERRGIILSTWIYFNFFFTENITSKYSQCYYNPYIYHTWLTEKKKHNSKN